MVLQGHINTAGRALSGWSNPRKAVQSPRMTFTSAMHNSERSKLDRFINDLFGLHFCNRFDHKKGDLRPFVTSCFAALLMYLPDLQRDDPTGNLSIFYFNVSIALSILIFILYCSNFRESTNNSSRSCRKV